MTGAVDWNVGLGGISGLILETNGTTANNLETITVRYDTRSPAADESDAVEIQASDGQDTEVVKRTVFDASIQMNFENQLHDDNALRFPAGTGNDTDNAGFNWTGDDGATRPSAKMESIVTFEPSGIDWQARGVSFYFTGDTEGEFTLRLQRYRLAQAMRGRAEGVRNIEINDEDEIYDGGPDAADAQYPTDQKPDRAFRIDAPGVIPFGPRFSYRSDFTELAEWHNGSEWIQISVDAEGEWFANVTALPPDATKGGDNNHGAGHNATPIPNEQPGEVTVEDRNENSGANVRIFLSPLIVAQSPDADPDGLSTGVWEQTSGGEVDFETTSRALEFTAPTVTENTELTFRVKWKDATFGLHHHRPSNYESDWSDEFTITVVPD